MDNLTVVIPFYNGHSTLGRLLDSLPPGLPVIVVDDLSKVPLREGDFTRDKLTVTRPQTKGYFTGAVNAGLALAGADCLIVNQDAYFTGTRWLDLLNQNRERYGLIGEQPVGNRPPFPGYVHGSFLFIRRDVVKTIGLMNAELYPLWGSTGEYQLRACRAGFEVLPVTTIPDFQHRPGERSRFGKAMAQVVEQEPEKLAEFTRIPPEVSVIIPCYNYGRYLPDAIASLMAQTFQSFEVIIVDDASTDNSLEIAQSLADPWQAIRVIHLTNNAGTAGACNAGIKQANGKWIARLDADDMMRPHRLEQFFKLQLANPHSIIFDDLILVGSETSKYGALAKYGDDYIYPLPEYDFENLIYHNGVHCGIMFPKQAWLDTGGYPVEFRDGRDDWSFNIALGIKGYCGVKAKEPGYVYRRDGQNRTLTNTSPTKNKAFQEQLIRYYPDIYRGVRPMGCCGGGISKASSGGNQAIMAQISSNGGGGLPGKTGFEILEYIGPGSSDTTWWGPVTKTRYIFGGNRRVGYVDAQDAPGMLQMGDGGRKVFKIYVKATVVEEPVEITMIDESKQVKEPLKTAVEIATTEAPKPVKAKRGTRRK